MAAGEKPFILNLVGGVLMKKTLVIMAAGMGSRYGGLKQIDGMGPSGEILLEYSVFDAVRAGFDTVVFIISEAMRDQFPEVIGNRLSSRINVKYAVQSLTDLPPGFTVPEGRVKPWGTSQAILAATKIVETPFAVLNADDFYGREAFAVMADFLDSADPARFESAMVGYRIENTLSEHGTVTRGICRTSGGYLDRIAEIPEIGYAPDGSIVYKTAGESGTLAGGELCSMNFWGFTPPVFKFLEKDFTRFLGERGMELKSEWLIPVTVDDMIRSGETRVRVLESSGSWFGVTYPDDKPKVTAKIQSLVDQGWYPSPLFGGVR